MLNMKNWKSYSISVVVLILVTLTMLIVAPLVSGSNNYDSINSNAFGSLAIENETVSTSKKVYLGGIALGIDMRVDGLIVSGILPVVTESGVVTPLQGADIMKGDILESVNGTNINSMSGIMEVLDNLMAPSITMNINRNGADMTVIGDAVLDSVSGKYRIGLAMTENVEGIGTLTFVDPEDGRYGSLGHVIANNSEGDRYSNVHGKIHAARIYGVDKGYKGHAGQLIGAFDKGRLFGEVDKNEDHGVFGKYLGGTDGMELVPIASRSEVKSGSAEIVTSVFTGVPTHYSIEIVRAYRQDKEKVKGMMIRVTDPRLIDVSGGIVQGMSGSPILQKGKLIGAVTHVMIADSTKGYATYIDWMIDK